MNVLLVDAGPIVAAFNRSDANHSECAEALLAGNEVLVTCEAVITEACFILRRGGVPAAAQDLLRDIDRGEYQLPLQLADRALSIAKLMKKYADTPMSFADACLVDLATQLHSGRILTLDSDFHVYRWGRNQPFEMVVDRA